MSSLLLYCRPGFESECASEIHDLAGDPQAETRYDPRCGYVIYKPAAHNAAQSIYARVNFSQLVFTRQWFVIHARLKDLPRGDRIAAIVAYLQDHPLEFAEVFLEAPDSDAGKPLQRLCRSLQTPLIQSLRKSGLFGAHDKSKTRLHICFFTTDYAALGVSQARNSAAWPMGIPRLRRSREAPSRSASKLEEALLVFLDTPQRRATLQAGMQAVDLGAAPGGWSWVLARQGLHVQAVDNGSLADTALNTGLITPIRADGFRFQPPKPVDWLVCDMVEQPARIANLIAQWFTRGLCRHAIFNLKLPMKKRYQEYRRCLELLTGPLSQSTTTYELRGRQLYHDRDEITLCILQSGPAAP